MSKSGLAPIFSLEASMTCKKRTILNPWCQKKVVTMYNSDKAPSDNVLTLKHCLVVAKVVSSPVSIILLYLSFLCVLFSTSIQLYVVPCLKFCLLLFYEFIYNMLYCLQCAPTSTIQIMYTVLYSVQYAFYSMFVYLSTSLIMFLTMFILSITLITF